LLKRTWHPETYHLGDEFLTMPTGVIGEIRDFDASGVECVQCLNDPWERRLPAV
jgi:hypothetical protein